MTESYDSQNGKASEVNECPYVFIGLYLTLGMSHNGSMKTKSAIKLAGSAVNLALLLGISKAAVSQWGKDLPELRTYQLKELKPDWFKDATKGIQ